MSPTPSPDPEDPSDLTTSLFAEPADYYPAPAAPTTATHTMRDGRTLTLHLVGHNPLWGHHLWNAGRLISSYLEERAGDLVTGRAVLELGAGAGLPSVVCVACGARRVVATDYPDPDLVANLRRNLEEAVVGGGEHVVATGYCWGADVGPLMAALRGEGEGEKGRKEKEEERAEGFDVLILADLLFNHSEHAKLLDTVRGTLARRADAVALVFFTPYRPWLYERDMAFFDLARDAGFVVEKIFEGKMAEVMFKEDRGDEELRKTVFGYAVKWPL